ncbi:hypothetical protein L7F22_006435 [Adiantum nelumboides]|nr:hypothetical protein [Adiantum nelumboides]
MPSWVGEEREAAAAVRGGGVGRRSEAARLSAVTQEVGQAVQCYVRAHVEGVRAEKPSEWLEKPLRWRRRCWLTWSWPPASLIVPISPLISASLTALLPLCTSHSAPPAACFRACRPPPSPPASSDACLPSTLILIFSLGSAIVSWASKKQPTVALSSTEAEYRAACSSTCEVIWLRCLLEELGYPQQRTVLSTDNQSCIAIARNPVFHARTKHIEIQYHFVREKVLDGTLTLKYCPTASNPVDIFTKPLPQTLLVTHSSSLGLFPDPGAERGSSRNFRCHFLQCSYVLFAVGAVHAVWGSAMFLSLQEPLNHAVMTEVCMSALVLGALAYQARQAVKPIQLFANIKEDGYDGTVFLSRQVTRLVGAFFHRGHGIAFVLLLPLGANALSCIRFLF